MTTPVSTPPSGSQMSRTSQSGLYGRTGVLSGVRGTGRLPTLGPERRRRLPRLRLPRTGLLAYLLVMGPGLISASAGNDAGGIVTYAKAGAVFHYSLLWALFVTAISLIVVQEMCARMGAVTGKGLSDLIREEFSLGATALAMACLLIANSGITVSEFLGIAASGQIIIPHHPIPPWLLVPPMALLLWFLVTQQSSSLVEKVFLSLTFIFLVYVPAAFINTTWGNVAHETFHPSLSLHGTGAYLGEVVALVGTTISPYMQFFVQSSVVDKGASLRDYPYTRAGVISGSLFAIAIAGFIIIATATALCPHGVCPAANADISQVQDFASALQPVVGSGAELLFAVGVFGASMLAAGVLPLSTAYAVCETFGLESGTEKGFAQAPIFNGIFTGMLVISTIIASIPNLPIVSVLVNLQILNAVMLPILLIFILRLVNRNDLMGQYRNGIVYNAIAGVSVIILTGLSLLIVAGVAGIGPAAG